jgi:hypothetical protein
MKNEEKRHKEKKEQLIELETWTGSANFSEWP